jgi:hypothetical protein
MMPEKIYAWGAAGDTELYGEWESNKETAEREGIGPEEYIRGDVVDVVEDQMKSIVKEMGCLQTENEQLRTELAHVHQELAALTRRRRLARCELSWKNVSITSRRWAHEFVQRNLDQLGPVADYRFVGGNIFLCPVNQRLR